MRPLAMTSSPAGILERLAAAFLLALLAVGTLVLWIGVPSATLWAASKLADSLATHFVIGLAMTLTGMIVWGAFLFWLNGLYLRVAGHGEDAEDPDAPPRRIRGPLEPLLVGSLVIAIIVLFVWFFVFAENPSRGVWG
jgi:heme/copper-type cytochrome/quinol oxidase subunit 2